MTQAPGGQPTNVVNVYNHANKVFNLRKGLPIGAITWGSGSIGLSSISTLAKDLRRRFMGEEPDYESWHIDPENYTIADVAARVREFMYEDLYLSAMADWPKDVEKPPLGFVVAGYSPSKPMAEEYQFLIADGDCTDPQLLRPEDHCGVTWNGEPEAITRLILGHGTQLPQVLEKQLGVPAAQIGPAMALIDQNLAAQLVQPAMPFQDAIALAEFLVDLTIQVSRFAPGAPTVGGPIEVAAISKHEGV
jgi:hypothetical protein